MARVTTTGSATDNNFNADNGTGLQVRTKLNEVLTALRTLNAGSGDPSGDANVVAFQPHINTSTNELKICTSVSSGTGTFTTIGNITQTNFGLLSKTGGTLTGVLTAATGSTSAPSLNFGDGGTGFYKKSTNVIGFIANQAEVAFFDQNSFTIDNSKELRLLENSGSEYVALKAPSSMSANKTITFPDETGTVFTSATTSIANSNLSNSSVTVGSTAISLGSSATTIAGLTTLTSTNLQATNIKDTSGNNSSTAEQISQGRAKAWVNFDGTFGTSPFTEVNGGIRNAFNVSSVVDDGTGRYTINFASTLANSNYCVATMAGNFESTTTSNTGVNSDGTRSTTQFKIRVVTGTNNTADKGDINVAVFGD